MRGAARPRSRARTSDTCRTSYRGTVGERWVSFDCYGTLVDWNGGISAELARLFGAEEAPRLLERYHELEPQLEADGTRSYRAVLTDALLLLAVEERVTLPEGEE